jgi:uncharacterized protein (TIGR02001 family)
MKKTILALATLTTGLSASAQDNAPVQALAVSFDATYVSAYVFRGIELAGASFQPSVEASYGDFYAGVWYSDDFAGEVASEADLYAGCTLAVDETLSADFGVTRYLYERQDGDATELFAGLKSSLLLSPSLYAYYDLDNQSTSVVAGIGHSVALPKLGLSVDLSASGGFVQQTNGDDDYLYWGVGAAVPYKFTEAFKIVGAVNYSNVGASNPGGRHNEQDQVVYSIGASFGF